MRRRRREAAGPDPGRRGQASAHETNKAPGPPGRRWEWLVLAGILLAGLIVRGLYLSEIVSASDFARPAVDAGFHDYWARGLLTGQWSPPAGQDDPKVTQTPFLRPPGYPYFLAFVYWLTGGSYLAIRIVQMAMGLGNAVLVFLIGRRWFGRIVALVAAGGMAFYWALVYFEGELHAPVLLIHLLLWAILLLGLWAGKRKILCLLGAGGLLGLAALTRPNVLVFVPVAAVWAGWIAWRSGQGKRALAAMAALALPAAAAVALATVRNYVAAGDLVLVCSNGGINLYMANNERATGLCMEEIPELGRFGTMFDYSKIVRNLQKKLGRPLKHSEVSAWFSAKAFRFIRENPGRFLRLTGRKLRLFWGPAEIGNNKEIHYERQFYPVLRHLPGNFPLMAAPAFVGFLLLLAGHFRKGKGNPPTPSEGRRWEMSLLMALLVAALSLSVLPFLAAGRYRVPAIPFLLLPAGFAVSWLSERVTARRYAAAATAVAACAALYLLLALTPQGYHPDLAKWHYDRGVRHHAAGELPLALQEFQEALRADPQRHRVWYNMGMVLYKQGRVAEAAGCWQNAIRFGPERTPAHNDLAMALLELGQPEEALPHMQAALRLEPESALHQTNMGKLLLALRNVDQAVIHLRNALAIEPGSASAHYYLGHALMAQDKLDAAAEHLAAASQARPDWPEPHAQLGRVRYLQGRPQEALEHYREALRLEPDNAGVLNDTAWLLATCPDARHRDGAEAVRLAERACQGTRYESTAYLDTLGAAYAEAGDFSKAVETVEKAVKLAHSAGQRKLLADMQARLDLYRRQRPYRQAASGS